MEALTVVILAVAAVVIAAGIWVYLNSMVGMQQTSADFVVQSVEVRQMTGGICNLYLVVRNSGGQSFNLIQLRVGGPGGASMNFNNNLQLNPGQSWSGSFTGWACPPGWAAGTPLLVTISLRTPNNVVVTKNVNVIIQFGA